MSDYNGRLNNETGAVMHWLRNEQSVYRYWREQTDLHRTNAVDCRQAKEGIWTAEQAAKFNLADQMEAEMTEGAPDVKPRVYADLLTVALYEVNWVEIAANWLEE